MSADFNTHKMMPGSFVTQSIHSYVLQYSNWGHR